jgi:DNA-binding MarR family transcriptional regulator
MHNVFCSNAENIPPFDQACQGAIAMPKAPTPKTSTSKTAASKNKPTLQLLEDQANATFARVLNKIFWGRKYPRDYGTGERLHMAEIEIIDRVAQSDEINVTLLAEQLGVSKAAISPLVSKLEKKGYLHKTTAAHHSNIKHLSLTPKGKIASRGIRRYQDRLHRCLNGVSKAELEAHIKLLGRMEAFIDNLHDELREELNIDRAP